jgi:plastocyanin
MRAIPLAFLSLAGAVALLAPAAAAHAEEGGGITSFAFSVSPSTVETGGTVTLTATECPAKKVTVSSGVFETVTVHDGRPATAKVDENAKPGAEYDVTFDCKGEKGHAPLTIAGGSGGTHRPGTVKPGGGAHAGTGGSFTEPGPARSVAGWTLVACAVGGGVFLLRRRSGEGV